MKCNYNKKAVANIAKIIKNKSVLFISTKNIDYIRNTQEINIIKKYSYDCKIVAYFSKSYIVRILKIYFWLISHSVKPYDVVFIGFAPQLVLLLFKSKFKHSTVIIDFFISLYDTMVQDRKRFKHGGRISVLLHNIDEITIRYANKVICDTYAHGSFFSKEFNMDVHKEIVLYLEADKSIYYPRFVEKRDRLKDKFIVLYFGSILPLQGIEVVIKAIKILENERNIFFIVIGNLACTKTINAVFYKWMPQTELADKIAMSDLCLAGHFNGEIEKARRTIPGKAFIYDTMGKNIILGDNRANKELFKNLNNNYIFVEQGNPHELAQAILSSYKDWSFN